MKPNREELVKGLRAAADFFEQHPDFPMPYGDCNFDLFVGSKQELREVTRGTGAWDKVAEGTYFMLRKMFGPVKIDVNISRDQVCERIVVGTTVIPARPEEVVENVEWRCSESLFGGEGA